MTSSPDPSSAAAPEARDDSAGLAATGRVWIGVAVYIVLYLAWDLSGLGLETRAGRWIDALAYLPLNAAAMTLLMRAARSQTLRAPETTALRLLAVMYACTIAGNVILAYDAIERSIPATGSAGNTFVLLSYAFAIAALVKLPVAPRASADVSKYTLDVACIILSIGALSWTFVFAPIDWPAATAGTLILSILYPASCVVVLALISRGLLHHAGETLRRDVLWLLLGLFAQVTLDMMLALDYDSAPIQSSGWVLLIYPFTYVVIVRACELIIRSSTHVSTMPEPAHYPFHFLPAVSAGTVYVVLVWATLSGRRQPLTVLVLTAIVLNILFIVKQYRTGQENLQLQLARADAENRARYEALSRESQRLESVGRLAGGLAHDFNNLLTTVLANSEFALTRLRRSDPGHAEVSDIRAAAMRGAELIRQLLAFSRKSVTAPVLLQPDLVLREMERLLQRLAGDRHRLVLDLPADLGMVRADRGQIEQVLANLVTNARDAMPDGGAIVISGSNVELPGKTAEDLSLPVGHYVTLSVRDSGVGIPPDIRAHIFEPFFSTKARGKGTGLGLASSYGIMRQSNGGIGVESEVGRGSRLTLYLPRVRAQAVVTTPVSVPALSPARRARGETILLVEDELAVRQVTQRMLTSHGYEVLSADDADAARELFDEHGERIALLLTDVVMPGESGVALATSLRSRDPNLAVILMSGYTDVEIPEVGSGPGKEDLLPKPFSVLQLLAMVDARLLARRHLTPTAAQRR